MCFFVFFRSDGDKDFHEYLLRFLFFSKNFSDSVMKMTPVYGSVEKLSIRHPDESRDPVRSLLSQGQAYGFRLSPE